MSNRLKINRVGEIRKANNGMQMTIIAYRGCNDIDIRFEDGMVVYSKEYAAFKKGDIKYPKNSKIEGKIGETNTANNGMKMEIIAYRSSKDIDIRFENGVVVYNRSYARFKQGRIGCYHREVNGENRIGEINTANNGMKMKIIAYRNAKDIDIQFEDGTIVYGVQYDKFKRGFIRYPNKDEVITASNGEKTLLKDSKTSFKNRVGEISTATNGMKMKIISYKGNKDVGIQFEDGTIVLGKCYKDFKKGNIKYPIELRVGEIVLATNGLRMRIVNYRGNKDIDIQFEDGITVYNKIYADFKKGIIRHPNARLSKTEKFYGYRVLNMAYKRNVEVYYLCEKDGVRSILTFQQMMKNEGIKAVF